MSRSQMMDQVCMCLGGHAAEQVVPGRNLYRFVSGPEACYRAVPPYGDDVRHE